MTRCLIVDDEKISREGIYQSIDWNSIGIEVIGLAKSGEEGMKYFLERKPEIVITDVEMPKKDGLQMSKEIKDISPKTKIIILSAFNDFSYAQQAINFGVQNYLLKPVNENELLEAIVKVKKEIQSEKLDNKSHNNIKMLVEQSSYLLKQNHGIVIVINPKDELEFEGQIIDKGKLNNQKVLILNVNKLYFETLLLNSNNGFFSSLTEKGNILQSYKEARIASYIAKFWNLQKLTYHRIKQQREKWHKFNYQRNQEINELIKDFIRLIKLSDERGLKLRLSNLTNLLEQFSGVDKEVINESFVVLMQGLGRQSNLISKEELQEFTEDALTSNSFNQIKNKTADFLLMILSNYREFHYLKTTDIVEKIEILIMEDLSGDLSNKRIAEEVFLSPNYMGTIFKEIKGQLLSEYIIEKRLKKSKELIEQSEFSMSEISKLVGFSSQSYFISNFKKHFGITPKNHRRNFKLQ